MINDHLLNEREKSWKNVIPSFSYRLSDPGSICRQQTNSRRLQTNKKQEGPFAPTFKEKRFWTYFER